MLNPFQKYYVERNLIGFVCELCYGLDYSRVSHGLERYVPLCMLHCMEEYIALIKSESNNGLSDYLINDNKTTNIHTVSVDVVTDPDYAG